MNILLESAKRLQNVTFDVTPEQRARVAQGKLKNVTNYFRQSWAVRMRIGGVQQNIGITPDLYAAALFADMAHLYLVQLGARSFRKNDFNFDRATAEANLKHPTAAPLLGEIVTALFPNGVPAKPVPAKRKSLRADLADLTAVVSKLQKHVQVIWNHLPAEIRSEIQP